MQLSFGEQVKIVLKRQGITIKELASRIEAQTGKKMSRQNLTQRLGRDNFQEKDMFMVAEALGCSLTINLLDEEEPEVQAAEPVVATKAEEPVVETVAAAAEAPVAEVVEPADPEPVAEMPTEPEPVAAVSEEPDDFEEEEMPVTTEKKTKFSPFSWVKGSRRRSEETPAEPEPVAEAPADEEPFEEEPEEAAPQISREQLMEELNADIAALGDAETVRLDDIPDRGSFEDNPENEQAFEKEKQALLDAQAADREAELPAEELPSTSVNPYTLREYKSNTVRAHASRIGYVQVYSRTDHAWRDMTEWAFMGEQERRKALLGDQYEEPTYLD